MDWHVTQHNSIVINVSTAQEDTESNAKQISFVIRAKVFGAPDISQGFTLDCKHHLIWKKAISGNNRNHNYLRYEWNSVRLFI